MPKRTPDLAEKTGKRMVAKSTFRMAANRLRKHLEMEVIPATPSQSSQSEQRAMRSADRALYYRVVSLCRN